LGWVFKNGAGVERDPAAPIEVLNVEQVKIVPSGFELDVSNTGPETLTISQVIVDDSVWTFSMNPDSSLKRFDNAKVTIIYPWVEGDPHTILLIYENGIITEAVIDAATLTPEFSWDNVLNYGFIGFYVGIVPITLGLLWYPFMKRLKKRWINAILALTVGLLLFLFFGTLFDGFEIGAEAPSVFQGNMVVIICTVLSFLLLIGFDQYQQQRQKRNGYSPIGIAAPLLNTKPKISQFVLLGTIAGAPAILGTWFGGFIFSPIWGAVFLGIGAGAILQVIFVISKMLMEDHK
jgi:zinc transporter, ZIP family